MWVIGQRVFAEFEPELGLGIVTSLNGPRQLEVAFPEADVKRLYSQQTAPLRRLVLTAGQKVKSLDGKIHIIAEVREIKGLFQYESESGEKIWEKELEGIVEDKMPLSELLSKPWENPKTFDLRKKAWEIRAQSLDPEVRGLVSPRVTLLPHQLGIVSEVSKREYPRVLLSDEVGLGKTIEAGLIFSSLRALGRADRVLIVVPEGLQHQWLAEIYRRFHETFSLIDEARSEQEEISQDQSAFAMNQRVICSLQFLEQNTERLQQALDEEWDLLIVDEAHRLVWDEIEPSVEWDIVRLLGERSRGLLLLTATPQSQGVKTQFGLLHLVDPERFHDFETFQAQNENMREIGRLAEKVEKEERSAALAKEFKKFFKDDKVLMKAVEDYIGGQSGDELLQQLIDRHGTGRVLFRNRRARIKGFPERKLVAVPMEPPPLCRKWLSEVKPAKIEPEDLISIAAGTPFSMGSEAKSEFFEARCSAVLSIINRLGNKKALLICSHPRIVRKLQEWLRNASSIRTAIFDEDLEIVERDRQAAWFAEPDGAQLLLCSEIGGEGRNFQFCSHLILFDQPLHPDVLEQRIGRLDRIGQKETIQVHIPYMVDTAEEALLRFYDEALQIFTRPWGGAILPPETQEGLLDIARAYLPKSQDYEERKSLLKKYVAREAKVAAKLRESQESGVDLLIDINSFNKGRGIELAKKLEAIDNDQPFRQFIEKAFDHFGVEMEKLDERGTFKIAIHSFTFVESFPGLSDAGELSASFVRSRALEQEELAFITREHAVAQGALSLVLEGGVGKISGGLLPGEGEPTILFELLYVLETTAPAYIEVPRDLPTQLLRVVVTSEGKIVSNPPDFKTSDMQLASLRVQHELMKVYRGSLNQIFDAASKQVQKLTDPLLESAKASWTKRCQLEINRLTELSRINPLISAEEIEALEAKQSEGITALGAATPRLDAVRILVRP